MDASCPSQIFSEIGGEEWSSLSALRHCIGDVNDDKTSAILDNEMVGQRGDDKARRPPPRGSQRCIAPAKASNFDGLALLFVGNMGTPCLSIGMGAKRCSLLSAVSLISALCKFNVF